MKHDNWALKYGPPPEELPENDDSWLLLPLVIIGPLVHFGPQLGAIEAWIVDVYRAVDSRIAPIREFFLG
jgi:hypothetical protein